MVKPINVKNPSKKRTITIGNYILGPGQSRYIQFESLEEMYQAIRLQESNLLTIETELPPDILEGGSDTTGTGGGSTPVAVSSGSPKVFRDEFEGTEIDTTKWDFTQGEGHTLNFNNDRNWMQFTLPMVANTETILKTKDTFSFPFEYTTNLFFTNKQANIEVTLEFVSEDGKDRVGMIYGGSTSTYNAEPFVQTNGVFLKFSSVSNYHQNDTYLQVLSVTSSYLRTYNVYKNESFKDTDILNEYFDNRLLPNPAKKYYFQIRIRTKDVAPTTQTIVYLGFAKIKEYGSTPFAELLGALGSNEKKFTLPVKVQNQTYEQRVFSAYSENSIAAGPLAANAEFVTSQTYGDNKKNFLGAVLTDAPCTLVAETLFLNVWAEVGRVDVSANIVGYLEVPVIYNSYRVRVIMGETPSTFTNIRIRHFGT